MSTAACVSPRAKATSAFVTRFAGIELDAESVPDATKLLKFRRLLETHDLRKSLFTAINADLAGPRAAAARKHAGGRHADHRALLDQE